MKSCIVRARETLTTPEGHGNEESADTRALIDEFLTTDPEFSRMTARFRKLFDDRGGVDARDITSDRDRQSSASPIGWLVSRRSAA